MVEPRRIDLTTLEAPNKDDKKDKQRPTLRFNLALTESNDKTCPEFSYVELLKNTLEDKKEDLDPNDPFAAKDAAEHDKMVALAQSFEQKYGLKKKAGRIEDLVDLGEGYDETDAFIDNSEAYDEIVPATLTTKLGGFYINSGVLDFREVSDDSGDEFQGKSKKKRRKMRIESDDESEDGRKKKFKKRKFKDGDDGEIKKRKKKKLSLSSGDETNGIKKVLKKRGRPPKIKVPSPSVTELLQQQSASTSGHPAGVNSHSLMNGSVVNGESRNVNSKETLANIEACINAVASSTDEMGGNAKLPPKDENGSLETKLPAKLPSDLYETIEKIKKEAKVSEEGKCKFFTGAVNMMLLDIELKARQLQCGVRSSVFTHLAAYLPCNKETLIKRAKKLRLNQQDNKLKEPIHKLQQAISQVMPSLMEKYTIECQNAAENRLQEEKKDKSDSQDGPREDRASSDSDDDDKAASSEDTSKKRIMRARKKFEWTPEIRTLLCDVVRIKMSMFDVSKLQSQSAEDYLKAFLDAEIKPLWPKGWIQTRMLFKESRAIHFKWTNPVMKPKKTVIMTKPSTPQGMNSSALNLSMGNRNSQDSNPKPERLEMSPPGGSLISKPVLPPVTITTAAGVKSLLDYAEARSSLVTTVTTTASLSHTSPKQGASSVPSSSSPASSSGIKAAASNSSKVIPASAAEALRHMLKSTLTSPKTSTQMTTAKPPTPSANEANSFLMQFQKFAGSMYSQTHHDSPSPPDIPLCSPVTPTLTKLPNNATSSTSVSKDNMSKMTPDSSQRVASVGSNNNLSASKLSAPLKLPSPKTANSMAAASQSNQSANTMRFSPPSSSNTGKSPTSSQAFTNPIFDVNKNKELVIGGIANILKSPLGQSSQGLKMTSNGKQDSTVSSSSKSLFASMASPESRKMSSMNPRPAHQSPKPSISSNSLQAQSTYHSQVKSGDSLSMAAVKRHPSTSLGQSSNNNSVGMHGRVSSSPISITPSSSPYSAGVGNHSQKATPHSSIKQMTPAQSLAQTVASVRQAQRSPQLPDKPRSIASPTLNILGGITMSQLTKDAEMLAQQQHQQQTKTSQPLVTYQQQQQLSSKPSPKPTSNSSLQLPRPKPVVAAQQPATWTTKQLAQFLTSPSAELAYTPPISSSISAASPLAHNSTAYAANATAATAVPTMQVRGAGDAIITGPAPGTYNHGHQRQSPGASQSPHHTHSPQIVYASNLHGSSPSRPLLAPNALPYGQQFTDPSQSSHRY